MPVYKDEVRGTWYYDGRYTNIHGERIHYKKRGFKTKSEAKKGEQLFLLSTKNTTFKLTLNDVYNEYMMYSIGIKKQSTINKDKRIYEIHIMEKLGNKMMDKITTRDIIIFRSGLMDKDITYRYINEIMKTLNKLYNYANKIHDLEYNPIKKIDKLKEEKITYTVWDINEFKRFIGVIDDERYILAFTLLYFTGLRRGELLALTWNDYDGKYLNINKNCIFDRASSSGYLITTPKTDNSIRLVSLNKTCIDLLDSYKQKCSFYDRFDDSWYILNNVHPLPLNDLTRKKDKYEKIADVNHIRLHDFRHSHVSLLINNNIPLPAVAKRIGDNIDTVTKTYAHLFERSDIELLSFLDHCGEFLGNEK